MLMWWGINVAVFYRTTEGIVNGICKWYLVLERYDEGLVCKGVRE